MIVENRETSRTDLKPLQILLIEDNDADAGLIKEILAESERPHFAIERVVRLSAALERLGTAFPDVILLDLMLPDSFWSETFVSLHEKAPRVPIVILTGERRESHSMETIRKGAQDYLIKGELDSQTLVRTILHAIERQKTQDELRELNSQLRQSLDDGEKLIKLSQWINASLKMEELSKLLEKTIPSLLRMNTFSLFLLDEDSGALKLTAHNHEEWAGLESPLSVPENDGLMWNAVKLGSPVRLDQFSKSRFAVPGHKNKRREDSAIVVPLSAKNISLGALNLNNPFPEGLSESNLSNIIRVSNHLSLSIYNLMLLRHIESLTITDDLTQVYNRRYLWQGLYRQVEAFERHGRPFSILMVDLDYFKKVNDLFGHSAGDSLLRKTVQYLGAHLRAVDFLCRFGGEEFVAVLTETDGETALKLAERIRKGYAAQTLSLGVQKEVKMTISVGVAEYSKKDKISQLIDRADQALYAAKENGRNQCVLSRLSPI